MAARRCRVPDGIRTRHYDAHRLVPLPTHERPNGSVFDGEQQHLEYVPAPPRDVTRFGAEPLPDLFRARGRRSAGRGQFEAVAEAASQPVAQGLVLRGS